MNAGTKMMKMVMRRRRRIFSSSIRESYHH